MVLSMRKLDGISIRATGKKPGVDAIAQRIKSAGPGEIILMHDGGGDRSETVAALKQALPKLKEEGYRFVTVSELINSYPYQE